MIKSPDGVYSSITNEADLKDLSYVLKDFGSAIGLDTEGTSLDYLSCELLGISITHKEGFGYYIPVRYQPNQQTLWDNPKDFLNLDTIREYLNPIFSDPSKVKILHNAKFDMHILKRHGFTLEYPLYDTMIGGWILGNIHGAKYGLKELAERKLNIQMLKFKDVVKRGQTFADVPLPLATVYAGPDADMTLRLYNVEQKAFSKFPTLVPISDLEMPVIKVLQEMEEVGALVDRSYLKSLARPLKKEMDFYANKVYAELGEFNINSNEQLLEKMRYLTKKHLKDVTFETLSKFNGDYPAIDSYLRYSKRQKMHSVYVDGILKLLDKNDRVHTEYQQNKKTGRLSSNNPNLQNIPTKKDDDDEYASDLPLVRKAFIAKLGCKIVSIDYSQLELRIMAHVANEPTWLEAFNSGADIHRETAAVMFKIPPSRVTKPKRKIAKTINFGLLYLMTEFGLSRRLKCSIDEAKGFIDTFFENLPMIKAWMDDRREEIINRKYVETEFGRRLYFNYDLSNPKSLPAAIREGTNFPIQGFAADIMKRSMIQVADLIRPYKTDLILQVHDELDFEMPDDEMPTLIPQITELMSNSFKIQVPLSVDCEWGTNWEDLQDWE